MQWGIAPCTDSLTNGCSGREELYFVALTFGIACVFPTLDGDRLGSGHVGPPYTQADFNSIASLGANYVNLSVPGIFTERPPYRLDKLVLDNLDALVEMTLKADLYVVISFRTGPGRSDFTFYRDGAGVWFDPDLLIEWVWTERSAQDAWVAMWRTTAEHYRNSRAVVGYDIMVEPNADEVMLNLYSPKGLLPKIRKLILRLESVLSSHYCRNSRCRQRNTDTR